MSALLGRFLAALGAGAVLMTVLSFTVYRRSYYYKRHMAEAGVSTKRPGILSRLITVVILLAMILFVALFDLWILSAEPYSLAALAALNLLLVTLLSLFDALFIDIFMLLIWRPAFLHMPEGQPTRAAMERHVKLQFTKGWIFMAPMAIVAAVFARLAGTGTL